MKTNVCAAVIVATPTAADTGSARGFSRRNLFYIRRFAALWPEREKVPSVMAQIAWTAHRTLLDHFSDEPGVWQPACQAPAIIESMDEPTTLTELLTLDDMTRAFWPSGLSGASMQAEDSLRYLRDSIALAHLVDDVPEAVRDNFERLRKTYLYGLVEYDLFTVADDDARLILEGVLRVRFVTYYDGEIPVTKDADVISLSASSFDDVREAAKRKYRLVTPNAPVRCR